MAVSINDALMAVSNTNPGTLTYTAGDIILKFGATRDGTTMDETLCATTGGTTYTEAGIETQTDADDRMSSGLWWIPTSGGSEDTTVSNTGYGAGHVSISKGAGTTYDYASAIYRSGQKGYGVEGSSIWQVTSAATTSLTGDYLLIVVGFLKTDSIAPMPALEVNSPAVTDDAYASSEFYHTAPYVGVLELTSLSGTQTATLDMGTSGDAANVSMNIHTLWIPADFTTSVSATRWRDDSASESANSGWLAAEDTAITGRATETNTRLRVQVQAAGDVSSSAYKIQYRKASDADSEWEDLA